MNVLWIYIFFALLIQETALTELFLFRARQAHLSIWLIHLLWLLATTLDVYLGYKISTWFQKKFKNKKIVLTINRQADKIKNIIGWRGEGLTIFLLSTVNLPCVTSFIASWLKVNYKKTLIYTVLGDLVWYVIVWVINIGLQKVILNSRIALYAVIIVALLFTIFSRSLFARFLKRRQTSRFQDQDYMVDQS